METLYINFDGMSTAEANMLAAEMKEALEIAGVEDTEIKRASEDTQDAGTILAVVLGAPAIVELAKGLMAFLMKRRDVKISITDKDFSVVAENLSSDDLHLLMDKLQSRVNNGA